MNVTSWDQQAHDRRANQHDADWVQRVGPALGRGRRGQVPAGEQQDRRADRQVDEDTARQPSWTPNSAISTPPMSGPIALDTPTVAPN